MALRIFAEEFPEKLMGVVISPGHSRSLLGAGKHELDFPDQER